MPKKELDTRVTRSISHGAAFLERRAGTSEKDEPDAAFVKAHTLPETLPEGFIIKVKGRVTVAGLDYTQTGNQLTWEHPIAITATVTAHDPVTDAKVWEWSAYAGDAP